MKPSLTLPNEGSTQIDDNCVIVGANGSGKSRLGYWLEKQYQDRTHRISAQRALRFQPNVALKALDEAEKTLFWGNPTKKNNKLAYRWSQSPTNHVLQDFDAVLATLFARERQRDHEYVKKNHIRAKQQIASHSGQGQGLPSLPATQLLAPESEIDHLRALWKLVFPQRELVMSADSVKGRLDGGAPYAGVEMSDGERVAIYLAGQALCAQEQTILIIDEPEIHLHVSLLAPLFDSLERLRPDCLFVYITHSLDFASSRVDARKLWVKSFDGASRWDLEEVQPAEGLPEPLLLKLLGNRRPVLFVEGDAGSLDAAIYGAVYANHCVVPQGGCAEVLRALRAYDATPQLSRVAASAVIDRDRRSASQVAALAGKNVHVLAVAEVENLLLKEDVVRFVARHLKLDADSTFAAVKASVFQALGAEITNQAFERACARLVEALSLPASPQRDRAGLVSSFQALTRATDPGRLFDTERGLLHAAVNNADYEEVLKLYNRKSLLNQVAPQFGLVSKGGYTALALRLLKASDADGEELRTLLQGHLPRL